MVRKPLLLILALAGFASADTGFPSTIKVTETDNSPSCVAGQIKFGAGQVSCSGQTATVTITGGSGGASSLAVTAGPQRSSPTSDVIFNPNQFSGSVSGSSITISLQPGVGMSPNATYYIQVRDTLQSGATFYVSSGAVAGKLSVVGPTNGNAIESSVLQSGNIVAGKAGSFTCDTGGGSGSSCYGVYGVGKSSSTGSDGVGVSGISTGNGTSYGLSSLAIGTGINYGGYFSALNGASNYGIYVANGYSYMAGSATVAGAGGLGVTYGVSASSVAASSVTVSGQTRTTSLLINSTVTVAGVGVCLADGTNCTSTGGSGGMSPGATYYIQVRDTLQTGATFYVSSGTVSGQLTVSTLAFAGAGLLTATQNGFTGPLVISTGTPTTGQALIAASSYSITATPLRSTILAVDSNGVLISTTVSSSGGSGSGSVVASPYGQVPYYTGVDTTTLTGNPNFTMDQTSWTVHIDSVEARGVLFDYVTSSVTVSSITATYVNGVIPGLVQGTNVTITGTWPNQTIAATGGGGGASSLETLFGNVRSSPTSTVRADAPFTGTVTGSTNTLGVDYSSFTMQGNSISLSALSSSMTAVGLSTGTLQSMINATGVSTGTLLAQIYAVGADTGSIRTAFNTSTNTLQSNINAVGAATGTLRTDLIAVGAATATIRSDFDTSTNTIRTSINAVGLATGTIVSDLLKSSTTWTAYRNIVGSTTFTGAIFLSTSIVTSGQGPGASGQVLQSQGPGAAPIWATSSGGGYATVQDEASNLTQRTTLNFTGTGVSCADNAGSSRTDCTINSGAATAGGVPGNVQINVAGSIVGASSFNVWPSSIVVSTGASTGYELYGATLAIVSSTTLSGITKVFASTFTNTAQWNQVNAITFDGRQGYTDQLMKSSGTSVTPKWGAIHKIMTTTATITATGNTPSNVLQLQYNLVEGVTYYVRCELVFRTTATAVGAGAGLFTTVGSTGSASVRIPVAADGTAGAYHGWITTNADSVIGTGVQAANISYVMSMDAIVNAGSGASINPMIAAEGGAGQMTLQAGSLCVYQGDDPRP